MEELLLGVELAILAAVTWPTLRILADRRFRRLFPWISGLVAALLLVWFGLIGLLAALAPAALHVLAPLAGALAAAAAVRARSGFGRRRGLPPGSLSLSGSIRGLAHRRFYLEGCERHGPIFKAGQFHRGTVCVVGLERGHRLLRENAGALGAAPLPLTDDVAGGFLRYMDAATYRRYGPLLRAALARPVIARWEPEMAAIARRELEAMAAAAERSASAVAPTPFLERIVHDSFLGALLGLRPGTEAHERFDTAYRPIAEQDVGEPLGAAAKRALPELRSLLLEHLEHRHGERPSSLAQLRGIDPQMPDEVCIDNLVLTVRIASSNVTSLLHWLLEMLGRHPAWIERMRRELAGGPPAEEPDLADRILMETLRLNQSEYLYRRIEEECEFEGFRLPRGWFLRVCVWESHRSPDAFERPDNFDPDRFLDTVSGSGRYSPFGRGEHACNGIPLTKSISRAVLAELCLGFDWTVRGTGSLARDFRHWSHWRPGTGLALELSPLERAPTAGSRSEHGVMAG